jgi:dipeptidyl aminopeptidase/acylaminoacyl peptidase
VLDGDRTIFSVSANDRGQLAFAAQDDVEPGDLYRFDPGQGERRLTAINAEALAGVEIVRPVHFTFEGTRGQAVDSWIVPPADAKLGERRPLIMNTHRGAHGLAFFFEFQFLAARGYGVLYCNHVGAQGYGPDYAVGQDKAWGGPDVEEMLRSIEAAAARFDFVDGARVGTTGLSAGGFYTNWLLSRTDRFKAGVSEGGIYNWLSKFGTSDIGTTYVISEMGGLPWERRDDYWRHSPLAKVDHVTAPLLIIHADEDHRCDITESEQMFRALRYLGRTVELLWVRGESHGFSRAGRPVNRIERLRRIADWFDRHL